MIWYVPIYQYISLYYVFYIFGSHTQLNQITVLFLITFIIFENFISVLKNLTFHTNLRLHIFNFRLWATDSPFTLNNNWTNFEMSGRSEPLTLLLHARYNFYIGIQCRSFVSNRAILNVHVTLEQRFCPLTTSITISVDYRMVHANFAFWEDHIFSK